MRTKALCVLPGITTQILNCFSLVYGRLVVVLAGGLLVWVCFVLGFSRVRDVETAEEISKERTVSDTESFAFQDKFGPKATEAQRSLLSLCIGLRER